MLRKRHNDKGMFFLEPRSGFALRQFWSRRIASIPYPNFGREKTTSAPNLGLSPLARPSSPGTTHLESASISDLKPPATPWTSPKLTPFTICPTIQISPPFLTVQIERPPVLNLASGYSVSHYIVILSLVITVSDIKVEPRVKVYRTQTSARLRFVQLPIVPVLSQA